MSAKYRRPTKAWRIVSIGFPAIALLLSVGQTFHFIPSSMMLYTASYLYLMLALLLPVVFIWIPINSKASKTVVSWYDIVFAALGMAISFYFVSQQRAINVLGWDQGSPLVPFIGSLIMWMLLIEASRRAAGKVMAALIIVFSVYPFLSPYLPGFLFSPGFSLNHMASFHMFGEDSVMGQIFQIFGSLIIGYMFFGAVIQIFGAGTFFNDLCMTFLGKTRASNAKVAIVASGLFGMISGSPISNIMTVGTLTIPAMKKEGFPSTFAAAIEACASSGGVLMPPVMGAVAFIMAEYLRVSYADVCIAAAVPAFLYYMTLYAQIDSYAGRIGLRPVETTHEVPPIWKTLLKNVHIIAGFVILILILFVWRITTQAPWVAIVGIVLLGNLRKETRRKFADYVRLVEDSGRILAELLSVLAPIGLIIGSMVLTGLAYTLPNVIVGIAGGNTLFILILGAFTSFILGMGVTSAACYIFLAIILAPALAKSGLYVLALHLFILYWSILSNITPPVAIAAFTAASVAGADPMKTGYRAMILGMAKYILPFVFVFQPALILHGTLVDIAVTISTATVGLVIISGALEGYLWWLGNLTVISRMIFFVLGMLLVVPSFTLSAWGAVIFAALFVLIRLKRREENTITRMFLKACT